LALLAFASSAGAQRIGAHEIAQGVYGFGTTARVLMIGAHPDDEDTALLTWLALGRQVEAAYLSLTRGDGGQNLIGDELGEALGAIRTEELLAARRIDGARQYFSRAYDFGYSKDSAETFAHWPRDTILGDVVRVVRAFRPHVILGVFSGTAADGHGHHTASGVLARDAYDGAGDTVRFPEGRFGTAWMPSKFYRVLRANPQSATLRQNVGEFDPVLGRAYGEIAGESRSQHKSQGFGAAALSGVLWNHVRREATRVNAGVPADQERSLFDGLDTSWTRLRRAAGSRAQRVVVDSVPILAQAARAALDLRTPAIVVPFLARAAELLEHAVAASPCRWAASRLPCTTAEADLATSIDVAHRRVTAAVLAAAGVRVDALADREFLAVGDTGMVTIAIHNRGLSRVVLQRARVAGAFARAADTAITIERDSTRSASHAVAGIPLGGAWWLKDPRRPERGYFTDVSSPADGATGRAPGVVPALVTAGAAVPEDGRRSSWADLTFEIAGAVFSHRVGPFDYRRVDPVAGEVRRPLVSVPAVSLVFDRSIEIARADQPVDRVIRLRVRSLSTRPRSVRFEFAIPPGVTADGLLDTLTLEPLEIRDLAIRIRGRLPEGQHGMTALAVERTSGHVYRSGFFTVEYPHIRPVVLSRLSGLWVKGVRVELPAGLRVGYVPGVSDDVGAILAQLDVPVTNIDAARLVATDLTPFNVIVIGPRAYQRTPALADASLRLEQFARAGGTVVVQYGQHEMQRPGMLPFPIAIAPQAQRVTREDAEVRIVDPTAAMLVAPNRITAADFANWVQERSLYLPSRVDSAWHAPLEMNDPGEPPNRNALLIAQLGSGTYVYTTLSLFRQLPAGNDGAIRLFANLLGAGRAAAPRR
jgi:LmbE family N-acetylglucosaminyl deacetylase